MEYILSLAGTALSLLAACVTFAVKFARAVKAKKETLTRERLAALLPDLIRTAEQFAGYTGEEKKEFVLTKVNRFAIENGLRFDLTYIGDKIEELVALSKQVNKRPERQIQEV